MRFADGLTLEQIPGSNTIVPGRGFTIIVRERDPDDPIAEPDLLVQIRRALDSSAGVTGGELRVHRVSNGLELGGLDPTITEDTTVSPVGYFGDSAASDVRIVFLHDDFRPAEAQKRQTLTGTEAQLQIEPDDLTYLSGQSGTGVSLDTGALELTLGSSIGGRALYSWLKDQWRSVDGRTATVFPILPRGADLIVVLNGWSLTAGSIDNLSDSGLEVWSGSSPDTVTAQYANLKALVSPGAGVTCYYVLGAAGAATNLSAGQFNDAIDITTEKTALVVRARPAGRTFASVDVVATQGNLTARSYGLTLETSTDSNLQSGDTDNDAPYSGMTLTDEDPAVSRTLGGSTSTFDRIVDANGGSYLQAYTWGQAYLRKAANLTEPDLWSIVGGTLVCEKGVYIDNIGSGIENVLFTGLDDAELQSPAFATVSVTFDANLTSGGTGKWQLFVNDANYPGATPTAVTDVNGATVHGDGSISASSISFSYDHATNGDLDVVAVATNEGIARYTSVTGTIGANGLTLALVSDAENSTVYDATDTTTVTIDGGTKHITLGAAISAVTPRALYVAWVQWLSGVTGLRYAQAFSVDGGRTVGGRTGAPKYVLENGWQVASDHDATVDGTGSLFAASGNPLINTGSGPVTFNNIASVDAELLTTSEIGQSVASGVSRIEADVDQLRHERGLTGTQTTTITTVDGVITRQVTTIGGVTRTISKDGVTVTVTGDG